MKKSIVLLFLMMASFSVNAQELTWHTDVNKASDLAIKEKKSLMLFFTGSDWCGWCMRLQKEVFVTPEFVKWAKENVVLVELDFPKRKVLTPELQKQNAELEQMFGVRGYPTTWLVKPSKKDAKVAFERLGSVPYIPGGPLAWQAEASRVIGKK